MAEPTRSASRGTLANVASRRFNRRDIEHVLRNGAVDDASWDGRFRNWTYRVRGADLDGDELTLVIALDPAWARITIITGF